MLFLSIGLFVASIALCSHGGWDIHKRSEQWDRDNPVERFVTKEYHSPESAKLLFPIMQIMVGFCLLVASGICYIGSGSQ